MTRNHPGLSVAFRTGLIVLLLGISLATAAPGLAQQPPPTTLQVVGPSAPVQVGRPFTVVILVENAKNLGSFEFQYVFDSSLVTTQPADIHLDSFLGSTGRNTGELRRSPSPPDPDRVIYGAYSYGSELGPHGEGTLARVTMTATAPGTSDLVLENLQVTDISGILVRFAGEPGTVEVTTELPPTRPLYLPMLLRQG